MFNLILLTTTITILIPLLLKPIQSYTFDCVKLPRPPLHGRVRYSSGIIRARLKCTNPNEDLPLNAPGDGGILTCDPSKKTFDFSTARLPKCLEYKKPGGLRMPARFMYTLSQCSPRTESNIETILFAKLIQLVPKSCSKLLTKTNAQCKWDNFKSKCGDNFNKQFDSDKSDSKKMVIVKADLVLNSYDGRFSVDDYGKDLAEIRSKYSLTNRTLSNIDIMNEPSVRFRRVIFAKSWQASCTQNSSATVGTSLAFHRVASCRGCPVIHFLDELSKVCWHCDRGYYTRTAFSSRCEPCPSSRRWASEEKYIEYCGSL